MAKNKLVHSSVNEDESWDCFEKNLIKKSNKLGFAVITHTMRVKKEGEKGYPQLDSPL